MRGESVPRPLVVHHAWCPRLLEPAQNPGSRQAGPGLSRYRASATQVSRRRLERYRRITSGTGRRDSQHSERATQTGLLGRPPNPQGWRLRVTPANFCSQTLATARHTSPGPTTATKPPCCGIGLIPRTGTSTGPAAPSRLGSQRPTLSGQTQISAQLLDGLEGTARLKLPFPTEPLFGQSVRPCRWPGRYWPDPAASPG